MFKEGGLGSLFGVPLSRNQILAKTVVDADEGTDGQRGRKIFEAISFADFVRRAWEFALDRFVALAPYAACTSFVSLFSGQIAQSKWCG